MYSISKVEHDVVDKLRDKPVDLLTIQELTTLFMEGTPEDRLSAITRLALYGLQTASSAGKSTTSHLKLLLDLSKAIEDAQSPTESTPKASAAPPSLSGWDPEASSVDKTKDIPTTPTDTTDNTDTSS